jgi:hypothetical protein
MARVDIPSHPIDVIMDDPNADEDSIPANEDVRRTSEILDARVQKDGELSDSDDEGEGDRHDHADYSGKCSGMLDGEMLIEKESTSMADVTKEPIEPSAGSNEEQDSTSNEFPPSSAASPGSNQAESQDIQPDSESHASEENQQAELPKEDFEAARMEEN